VSRGYFESYVVEVRLSWRRSRLLNSFGMIYLNDRMMIDRAVEGTKLKQPNITSGPRVIMSQRSDDFRIESKSDSEVVKGEV
jgi:hypothetical protein